MVVLEAWAAGTPALLSEGCHLPEGFAMGAALDCGTSPDRIAAVIAKALAMSDAGWLKMSGASRDLAAGPFSADAIAQRWEEAYATLLAQARLR